MTRILAGTRSAIVEVPLPRGRIPGGRVRELHRLARGRRGRIVAEGGGESGILSI
ncbi:MAG: hypothetical protein MIO92_01195 [Methanosarcinaceae archaeon]|nr:hypothetical protein [Methanosarcinaceae archaeon]